MRIVCAIVALASASTVFGAFESSRSSTTTAHVGTATTQDVLWLFPSADDGRTQVVDLVATPPLDNQYAAASSAVEQLPASPNSLWLGLTTILGIGAFHIGRAVKHVGVAGDLPEWYHASGVQQIGHATPLPLEFNVDSGIWVLPYPVAIVDIPNRLSVRSAPPIELKPTRTVVLEVEAPRGPPA